MEEKGMDEGIASSQSYFTELVIRWAKATLRHAGYQWKITIKCEKKLGKWRGFTGNNGGSRSPLDVNRKFPFTSPHFRR